MKLYLSSYQIGNSPEQLLKLLGPNKHAALILNASDVYGDSQRPLYVAKFKEQFAALGITSEELDLRKYFVNTNGLETELRRFGLLWITGGNTFALRRALAASGLDEILPRILENSDLVYGGFSAGACVVSPTLKWIHLADEPENVPIGYSPKIIWDGVGLIDFHIVPHYRSPHPESAAMEKVVEYLSENGMKYQTLMDGEAIVSVHGSFDIVGRP